MEIDESNHLWIEEESTEVIRYSNVEQYHHQRAHYH